MDPNPNDSKLLERVDQAAQERKDAGLENLVGGLEAVIINVPEERHPHAVKELLRYTGLGFHGSFQDHDGRTSVLKLEGSADFLVRTRRRGANPFLPYSTGPRTEHIPEARLETYVFRANDLERYVALQRDRGVAFMTDQPVQHAGYDFIQTMPSPYTGNSLGFLQWRDDEGEYITEDSDVIEWVPQKPDLLHLGNIGPLDHAATRVKAEERDDAIVEFMLLTGYDFDFAVYVELLNSITNVARLTPDDFAMVFTSGIQPWAGEDQSGPTEQFIKNYGLRTHHLAFDTDDIDNTYRALGADGMEFLVELVGSREDGLKQTFTQPSANTFLVNEYIHRYGGFDGFFTKSNVTTLTRATERQ